MLANDLSALLKCKFIELLNGILNLGPYYTSSRRNRRVPKGADCQDDEVATIIVVLEIAWNLRSPVTVRGHMAMEMYLYRG